MANQAQVLLEIDAMDTASTVLKKVREQLVALGQEGYRVGDGGLTRFQKIQEKLSIGSLDGVGRMRQLTSSVAFLGLTALHAEGPVAKLGEGLLAFGGGEIAVLAVGAALLGAGLLVRAFGKNTEEAKKKFDDMLTSVHKAFVEGRPDYEKFLDTQGKLKTAVVEARIALIDVRGRVQEYEQQLRATAEGGLVYRNIQQQIALATKDAETAQNKLNQALHALGELRGQQRKQVQDMIQDLRLEALSVGKTADETLRLRLEADGVSEVLIQQAVHWVRVRDAAKAALDVQMAAVLATKQQALVPERFIEERGRDTGTDSDKDPAKRHGLQRIAQGIEDATSNAQTLNQVLADMATTTLTGLADAFTNAFQAAFDGSQNVAKAFAGAMLAAIRTIARQMGMLSLADSIRALAHGILGDPKGFAAAGKFAAAAAGYFAVAGAAGALGGGGGGGGGTTSSGAFSQQAAAVQQPPLTLVFKGAINSTAPEFVDAVAAAFGEATGRGVIVIKED